MKSSSMFINFFLIVFLVYFIITVFLFFYQRKLLYHPSVNSRSIYTLDHQIEEIKIPSEKELIAWYYKKNENYKTLVFFHGNAGDLSNRIYKLNELSKLNLNYLIFAYRGFNDSEGKPSEEGLYKDAENVIKWLKSKNILENKIILYGESLGTAVAIHTAQSKNFSGIILEAPFTSIRELVKEGQKKVLEQQFRRAIFNIVARNQDDHTKNIAFLMDKKGNWKLSPAYDVAYSYNPNGPWTSKHQMRLNGKRDDFTLEDLIAFGEKADISEKKVKTIVAEITNVVRKWKEYFQACKVPLNIVKQVEGNLRLDLIDVG